MENIVLISVDCLRPEALSCYEEEFDYFKIAPHSDDTPTIDSIANEGVRFTEAFCQAPFTPASHASIFTGTNPYRHGIRSMFNCHLRDDLNTLAEIYREDGYETGAFIGAHALSSYYGLDRGFERFDDEFDIARENSIIGNRRPGSEVTEKALNWINKTTGDTLLFLHYFDAHGGPGAVINDGSGSKSDNDGTEAARKSLDARVYDQFVSGVDDILGGKIKSGYLNLKRIKEAGRNAPKRLRGAVTNNRTYHLNQVQKVDEQIKRIKTRLEEEGIYDETTIVIFGDHGDAFGEHGEHGHRRYLYDTTLRVPLIIKPGGDSNQGRQVSNHVVRLIDIYPTLLQHSGITDSQSDGEDLLEHIQNDEDDFKAYAETRFESSSEDLRHPETDYVSLRTSKWKLIVDQLSDMEELYRIDTDPQEQSNIADERTGVVGEMSEELETITVEYPDKLSDIDDSKASPAVVNQLEGLGYL